VGCLFLSVFTPCDNPILRRANQGLKLLTMDEPLDLRIHNRDRESDLNEIISLSPRRKGLIGYSYSDCEREPGRNPPNTNHNHPRARLLETQRDWSNKTVYEQEERVPLVGGRDGTEEMDQMEAEEDEDGALVIAETENESDQQPLKSEALPLSNSHCHSPRPTAEEDAALLIQISVQTTSGEESRSSSTCPGSRTGRATSKHLSSADRLLKSSRLLCFLCDQKAKNGKTLETHILKSHSISTAHGRFICCTECAYRCTFVEQLKSHFTEKHSDTKSGDCKKAYYPCSHCSRMYRKQSLLDAHMRLVNQKDNWKKIIST